MVGLNLSFGGSVVKREAKPAEKVLTALKRQGWSETGRLGDRVIYLENSGIGITVVDGPMGTSIFPSGPIRGSIFGENMKLISQQSVLGLGASVKQDTEKQMQGSRRTNNSMV